MSVSKKQLDWFCRVVNGMFQESHPDYKNGYGLKDGIYEAYVIDCANGGYRVDFVSFDSTGHEPVYDCRGTKEMAFAILHGIYNGMARS